MTQILSLYNLDIHQETVCTIGNFDGVHRGHQKIIDITKDTAKYSNLKSVVITFHPHPKKVISPQTFNCSILNLETKIYLLRQQEVDYILIIGFDENFYKKSPKEFMDFLKGNLKCRKLIVGKDWRFGYNKEGDIDFAKRYGKEIMLDILPIDDISMDGERVSSTKIRQLLSQGEIKKANYLLGRDFFLREKIVSGSQIGRKIGYPTINLKADEDLCLKRGVYAGFTQIDEKKLPSVINFGYRPTVDGKNLFIESHILSDFEEKIEEDTMVNIYFVEYIREEKKFDNVDNLKSQIYSDILKTKEVLISVDIYT